MQIDKTSFSSSRALLAQKIRSAQVDQFADLALEVFHFQATYNSLYRSYLELINCSVESVKDWLQIPCLPIQFFKNHRIQTGVWEPTRVFTSSGTTGQTTSRHLLHDDDWYFAIAKRCFEAQYGSLAEYCVLGLLPAYLERQNSSLVFMVDYFIRESSYSDSGFFLYDHEALIQRITACKRRGIPVVLIGVSFALWDLAEAHHIDYEGLIVMETGGMKGRKKEITREALHRIYQSAFGDRPIHSEYGMTELLSQAYAPAAGRFLPGPTMRVRGREITDPFSAPVYNRTAALNIIDLANLDTISFIATDDLGKVASDFSFKVLGRMDNSDLRGCNLMIDRY
ncbi:MAG TPA: hypothetical protein VJ953_06885 [Saprospiraceae bacterium]|nr:hypothetical protein [Saprospiraceae bacterium]